MLAWIEINVGATKVDSNTNYKIPYNKIQTNVKNQLVKITPVKRNID